MVSARRPETDLASFASPALFGPGDEGVAKNAPNETAGLTCPPEMWPARATGTPLVLKGGRLW